MASKSDKLGVSPAQPPEALSVGISTQYIKDFSFESPNAPQIFAPTDSVPEMQMGVNVLTRNLVENVYEVILAIKLEARIDDKVAFLTELAYAGVFHLPAMEESQLKMFLVIECPRMLFPFARSILMNAIRESSFPQVMISPIDFAQLYMMNKDKTDSARTAGAA